MGMSVMSEFERLVELIREHGTFEATKVLSEKIDEILTDKYIVGLSRSIARYIKKHQKDPWEVLDFIKNMILHTNMYGIGLTLKIHNASPYILMHIVSLVSETFFIKLIYCCMFLGIERYRKSVYDYIDILKTLAEKYPFEVANGLVTLIHSMHERYFKLLLK